MKTLNNIKYILMFIIVFGFFANFAQNEYGLTLALYSLLTCMLIFIADTIYYRIKEKPTIPKKERSKVSRWLYNLSPIVALICISIEIIFVSDEFNIPDLTLMLTSFAAVIITFVYSSIYRPQFYESLFLVLFCIGMLFKNLHYPGAGVLMVIACMGLVIYFYTIGTIQYKEIKKENKWLAISVFCFLQILSISFLGFMFKMMHWPGANMANPIITVFLMFILIPIVIRKKFRFKGTRIVLWDRIKIIKGNSKLLFLFFSLSSIWWILLVADIAPNLYSITYPNAMYKFPENNDKEFIIYRKNYMIFLMNRQESEAKQEEQQ